MRITAIACLGSSIFVALTGAASAVSLRPTTYPIRCNARAASWGESDRVCYYFAMREMYGVGGLGLPNAGLGSAGYADPRAWRLPRAVRIHGAHRR